MHPGRDGPPAPRALGVSATPLFQGGNGLGALVKGGRGSCRHGEGEEASPADWNTERRSHREESEHPFPGKRARTFRSSAATRKSAYKWTRAPPACAQTGLCPCTRVSACRWACARGCGVDWCPVPGHLGPPGLRNQACRASAERVTVFPLPVCLIKHLTAMPNNSFCWVFFP